jgi:hypothetical protein
MDDPDYIPKLVDRIMARQGGITSAELRALQITLHNEQEIFTREFLAAKNDKQRRAVVDGVRLKHIIDAKEAIDVGTGEAARVLRSIRNSIALAENLIVIKTLHDKGMLSSQDLELFQAVLANPTAEAKKMLKQKVKMDEQGWSDLYYQFYFNSLLSNPATWGLNFGSTAIWSAYQIPHEMLTSAIDAAVYVAHNIPGLRSVLNKFYNEGGPAKRKHYFVDVLGSLRQLPKGVVQGAIKAVPIMRDGVLPNEHYYLETRFDPDLGGNTLETHQLFDRGPDALVSAVRTVGPIMSIPTRVMRASDTLFNTMAYDRKIYQIAHREARNQGLEGAERDAFIQDVIKSDKAVHEAYHLEAVAAARYSTFNDIGGKFTRHMMLLRHNSHIVRLLVPFLRTLVNLQKRGLEMLPGIGLAIDRMHRKDKKVPFQHGHSVADSIAKQIEGMANQARSKIAELNGEFVESEKAITIVENALEKFDKAGKTLNATQIKGLLDAAEEAARAIEVGCGAFATTTAATPGARDRAQALTHARQVTHEPVGDVDEVIAAL